MKLLILSKLESLLPARLQHASGEEARRARMVVWLSASMGPAHLLAAVVSTAVRGPNHLGFIVLAGAVGMGLSPVVQRLTDRPVVGAIWFLTAVQIAAVAVAWAGYGPLSPVIPTFLLFPFAGLILGGRRVGAAFGALAMGHVAALWVAGPLGYRFPMEATGARFELIYSLVMMLSILTAFVFIAAYDSAWRKATEAADVRAAQLEAANAAKSRFLANMSHELRTPLNAILGYTEMVLEDPSSLTEDLTRVHSAAHHLLKLVDGLLNLEKIESGHLDLHPETVDLGELCSEVLRDVRPLADGQHVELERAGVERCVVRVDPLRLKQVLLNVLSNACKFTPGGRVTVALAHTERGAQIDVTDTGVGMSDEELETVFEPFQQGVAGQHQGTGLGLAISRRLCEAMGGSLTATSIPGEGTRVRIALAA